MVTGNKRRGKKSFQVTAGIKENGNYVDTKWLTGVTEKYKPENLRDPSAGHYMMTGNSLIMLLCYKLYCYEVPKKQR